MFYCGTDKKNITRILRSLYPDGEPGAAICLIHDDKILLKKGYGLADLQTKEKVFPNTNFRMASVSKQFTAMGILLLIKENLLALNDPLYQFFPDLPAPIHKITVHQLLHHTSGIADYESLIPPGQRKQILDKNVLQLIRQKGFVYFSPGTKFKYSNTGYCLLALIIEKVSEKSFADFILKNIFRPLGMNNSVVFEAGKNIPFRAYGYRQAHDAFEFADQNMTSATQGDGGIYTSLNDYEKWIKSLSSYKLISKEQTENFFQQQAAVKENVSYRFGWFAGKETDGTKCIFHSGESTGFRNIVYANFDKQVFIALFSNRDDDVSAMAFDKITKLLGIQLEVKGARETTLFHWLSKIYQD